ncbi:MAG: LPXTG cell wall anchor domain-containing protein, partial [Enterococcus sp.]|nr:LPXTG cell wall anchor domain-containing protein [Enterococcus sp.]
TDTVTLDETGSGVSKELPLGTYDVQEIANSVTSTTGQVVNPKVYKVTLSYANETTKLVTSTSTVTNTPVLGEITITKTGVESGTEMWNSHYSLAGNEFKLTSKTDGKTYTIVTDEKGIAKKTELPLGKYLVEETKASPGFVNTFKPVEVELTYKNNSTEVVFGSAKGTNQEIKGENTLEKEDTETGKESQGKASMKNAEYQLFYDEDQTGKSPHKKGDFVKWSDIPKAKLLAGEKVTSSVINGKEVAHGDNVVINVDDEKLTVAVGNLALGKYVWREINAPEGYVLDKTEHRFELTKKDDKTQNIIAPTQVSKEQVIEAEVTIQKLVETQGETNESGYNGVEFTLTPLEGTKGEPVVVKTGVNPETNEDGFAQATLVYGDYVLKETKGVEGYDKIRDVYIHMETNEEKDLLTISASNQADFSKPFSKRTFSLSDNQTTENPNGEESVGVVSTDKPVIRLSKLTFTNKDPLPPLVPQLEPKKDVTKTEGGESVNHGDVALSSEFVYALKSSRLSNQRSEDLTEWTILDNYDERYDQYKHRFEVVATTNFGFGEIKKGNVLDKEYFIAEEKDGKVSFVATKVFLDLVNAHKDASIQVEIRARFFRHTSTDVVYNSFVETMNGEKIKSNEVDTKTPKPAPHKFTVVGEKVDLKGNKLLDDDDEMHDRYKETETDPYNDKTKNNEAFNFNTKMVKKGDELYYQLWLDTTSFDETSELSELQMVDDYDEKAVEPEVEQVKVYNAKGEDVTENFQAEVKEGKLTIRANVFTKVTDSKEEENDIVDTEKIPFGQVYKIEFSAKVKPSIKNKADIRNVASQKIVDLEKRSNEWPTETRVNRVNTPAKLAPHKFVLSKKQFDLTGNKLLDDDSELKDRYGETNKDPYVDQMKNNEKENINTQEVKAEQMLVYQLWLDTTSFDETNQLTALAMTDSYDAEAVSVDPKQVKVYDAKGKDMTEFFTVKDEKGALTISANAFVEAKNAKGETVKVVDTKKVSMGQIYKIDAPMTVKKDVKAGKDIVNTAKQESVDSEGTKLSQQTEKRVNHVSTPVEKVVKGVLPHTGETPSSRLVKVIGWLLLFGLVGFWKRDTFLRKYRRICRQFSK